MDVEVTPVVTRRVRSVGSGALGVGEFRCHACGYGIVSRGVLPVCPMCRGATWDESRWRPFTRAG